MLSNLFTYLMQRVFTPCLTITILLFISDKFPPGIIVDPLLLTVWAWLFIKVNPCNFTVLFLANYKAEHYVIKVVVGTSVRT